jgi:uncharacterized paraquat-inducible protein A
MANLILCPACHQMVSSMAASCPKCGHPLENKLINRLAWIAALIFFAVAWFLLGWIMSWWK